MRSLMVLIILAVYIIPRQTNAQMFCMVNSLKAGILIRDTIKDTTHWPKDTNNISIDGFGNICTINLWSPSKKTDSGFIYRSACIGQNFSGLHFYPHAYCPIYIKRITIKGKLNINSFHSPDTSWHFPLGSGCNYLQDSCLKICDSTITEIYKSIKPDVSISSNDTLELLLAQIPKPQKDSITVRYSFHDSIRAIPNDTIISPGTVFGISWTCGKYNPNNIFPSDFLCTDPFKLYVVKCGDDAGDRSKRFTILDSSSAGKIYPWTVKNPIDSQQCFYFWPDNGNNCHGVNSSALIGIGCPRIIIKNNTSVKLSRIIRFQTKVSSSDILIFDIYGRKISSSLVKGQGLSKLPNSLYIVVNPNLSKNGVATSTKVVNLH